MVFGRAPPLRPRIWPTAAVYDLSVAHTHKKTSQKKDTLHDALKETRLSEHLPR